MGPKCEDKCPCKRRAEGDWRQTEGGKATTEAGTRARHHEGKSAAAATSSWKGPEKQFSQRTSTEHCPDTRIWDFWPRELGENESLLFEPPSWYQCARRPQTLSTHPRTIPKGAEHHPEPSFLVKGPWTPGLRDGFPLPKSGTKLCGGALTQACGEVSPALITLSREARPPKLSNSTGLHEGRELRSQLIVTHCCIQ